MEGCSVDFAIAELTKYIDQATEHHYGYKNKRDDCYANDS